MLVRMGIQYDSEDAIQTIDQIMTIFRDTAYETSINLAKDNSYWSGRGVSESTLNLFDGGVATEGKFKNRFVFPIFNGKKQLIGITGRDVTGKNPIKWLHQGATSKWCYPLQVNYKEIIKSKEIIIVESIGDMLSLWEAGIKHSVVTFGVRMSPRLLTVILKINPDKITVALNNDDII